MSLLNDTLLRDIETILGIEKNDEQEGMEVEVPMETSLETDLESHQQRDGLVNEAKFEENIGTKGGANPVQHTESATQQEQVTRNEGKETHAETKMETREETQKEEKQKPVGEKGKNLEREKGNKGAEAMQTTWAKVDFLLGYNKDNFLTRDLKSACIYVAAELAPRLRQVITKHRSKFEVLFQLADACNVSEIRTCTNYNQGLRCGLGDCHLTHGYTRVHSCMLCWEGVWILAPHSLVNCPFIKPSFWETMGITNY